MFVALSASGLVWDADEREDALRECMPGDGAVVRYIRADIAQPAKKTTAKKNGGKGR